MGNDGIKSELGYVQKTVCELLEGKGDFAILDNTRSIYEQCKNNIAVFCDNGNIGTLFVTGQLDDVTPKGYNWAVMHDKYYVGTGMELVDVQVLLTEYRLLILRARQSK